MITDLIARLLVIVFLWGLWWLPGFWIHRRVAGKDRRAIQLPVWMTLPFGMPNEEGTLDAIGIISQLTGFWMGITSLLGVFGILSADQIKQSFLIMGMILVPLSILEELWAWRRR